MRPIDQEGRLQRAKAIGRIASIHVRNAEIFGDNEIDSARRSRSASSPRAASRSSWPLRSLKGTVHKYDNAVPIQILRRGTIERDEDTGHSQATRNWNFATALYYKSGGMPWRPSDLPDGVCFVGVSFHHLKKRGGHLVYASVAQAFSSDHEPFCLKGPHIDHEQRIDRQPYLNESQAFSMMRDILAGYEMRTGVQPKRVVVHKTSMYHCEEEKGFRDAAKGIVPGCDLVWPRQTPFRLVRKGSEEPWRGTLCRVEGESYLFTSGYVPWWDEFPGPTFRRRSRSGRPVTRILKPGRERF